MNSINEAIKHYQQIIGTYDKQPWERSVEQAVNESLHNLTRKRAKVNRDLIDVDLVRGSTFSKAKPQHSWLAISQKAALRVIFLPVYYQWWKNGTGWWVFCLLMFLYTLQAAAVITYFTDCHSTAEESLSLSHLLSPCIMMYVLALVHTQIMSTYGGQKLKPTDKCSIQTNLKCPKATEDASESGVSEHESNGSNDTGIDLNPDDTGAVSGYCICKSKEGGNETTEDDANEQSSTTLLPRNELTSRRKSFEKTSRWLLTQRNLSYQGERNENLHSSEVMSGTKSSSLPVCDDCNLPLELASISARADSLQSVLSTVPVKANKNCSRPSHQQLNEPSIVSNNPPNIFAGGCDDTDSFVRPATMRIGARKRRDHSTCDDSNATDDESKEIVSPTNSTSSSSFLFSNEDNKSEDYSPNACHSDGSESLFFGIRHRKRLNSCLRVDLRDEETLIDDQPLVTHDSDDDRTQNKIPLKQKKKSLHELSSLLSRRPSDLNLEVNSLSHDSRGRHIKHGHRRNTSKSYVGFTNDIQSCDANHEISAKSKACLSECDQGGNLSCGLITATPYESTSELSENDLIYNMKDTAVSDLELHKVSSVMKNLSSSSNKVSCMIWESEELQKVDLTVLDIGWNIIKKVEKSCASCDYLLVGAAFSIVLMLTPVGFRVYHGWAQLEALKFQNVSDFYTTLELALGHNWRQILVIVNGIIQRFCLGMLLSFLLTVSERTFYQRLLYAKNFCYLTSSRRARKYDLPHFRLYKVRNIKAWLSLRSFLKRRGPQRSVEIIVSTAFLVAVVIVSTMCIEIHLKCGELGEFQLLQDYGCFLDELGNWELIIWCLAIAVYLLRFITLGTNINKKYRNFLVLITEQINLYLHMEQKPHKKNELMMANSVLKLAEDLLKEVESPFKVSGLSANPLLYNITKVVVLSAFSAVLTELLGFKLKLYKIKIRA